MFKRAGKWLVVASIGVFLSVPQLANATLTSLGTLSSGSTSSLFGATSSGPIGDNYTFTLGGTSSISSFAASFEILGVFGLTNVQMDLYKVVGIAFTPVASGTVFGPTPSGGGFVNGSTLGPLTLFGGNYSLQINGTPTGGGGSYAGTLHVAAVPEPEVWAMMLIGAGLIGYQVRRKSKAGPTKIYGMT